MKRSNKVMLSAVFLAAIASATAKAQEAGVPATDTTRRNDSMASNDTSLVNYNDGVIENAPPAADPIYYVGSPGPNYGFFHFYWVGHWHDYHYYHHHHSRESFGPRTVTNGQGPRTTTPVQQHNGFRSSAPAQVNGTRNVSPQANTRNQSVASASRSGGFGNTMRTSHASAHS